MTKRHKIAYILSFAATILLALTIASAAKLPAKPAQSFKDWHLFIEGEGKLRQCYILSQPRRSTPRVNRGDIFFTVTNRPGQGVRHEISVRIGYPFSQKSKPYAKIDANSYLFFTGATIKSVSANWAWLRELGRTNSIMTAMKRGNEMVFRGTSARGTLTTDYYGLRGFTAALAALDKACGA